MLRNSHFDAMAIRPSGNSPWKSNSWKGWSRVRTLLLHRIMSFFRRFGQESNKSESTTTGIDTSRGQFVADGDLKFTIEQGGNGSQPSYQEVSGAPVEVRSPLGYTVGPVTVMFLNMSMMVGTGVYSTRQLSPYPIGQSLPSRFTNTIS
jgi:hypothetical protein